jgi:hypothetical protein
VYTLLPLASPCVILYLMVVTPATVVEGREEAASTTELAATVAVRVASEAGKKGVVSHSTR